VTTLGRYQHQLTKLVDSGSQVSCSGRKTYRTQPKVAKFSRLFRLAVHYSLWVSVKGRCSYVDGT
jgi:hypothetical protein